MSLRTYLTTRVDAGLCYAREHRKAVTAALVYAAGTLATRYAIHLPIGFDVTAPAVVSYGIVSFIPNTVCKPPPVPGPGG